MLQTNKICQDTQTIIKNLLHFFIWWNTIKQRNSVYLLSQGNCYVLKINNKSLLIQERNLHFHVYTPIKISAAK